MRLVKIRLAQQNVRRRRGAGLAAFTPNFSVKFFWTTLLICMVMLAPLWAQIHQVMHGAKGTIASNALVALADASGAPLALPSSAPASSPDLFGDHAEGSGTCQLLDHLGLSAGLRSACTLPAYQAPSSDLALLQAPSQPGQTPAYFSARAPPFFL